MSDVESTAHAGLPNVTVRCVLDYRTQAVNLSPEVGLNQQQSFGLAYVMVFLAAGVDLMKGKGESFLFREFAYPTCGQSSSLIPGERSVDVGSLMPFWVNQIILGNASPSPLPSTYLSYFAWDNPKDEPQTG